MADATSDAMPAAGGDLLYVESLQAGYGPVEVLHGLDLMVEDREIVVVCSKGYTSSLAAASLQELGLHRATDLAGGFRALGGRRPPDN